jgi:hypothetical protein
MKKKVLEIFRRSIKTFKNLEKIDIIATFGSIMILDDPLFDDLDVIVVSKEKSDRDDFISHLANNFKKENFEPIVFKLTIFKPKKEKDNQILIHAIEHYKDLPDLLEKQWKSVVNSMKKDMVILHGDKNFPDKLPLYTLNKKELLNPLFKWSKKINSEAEFINFQKYLLKIIPILKKDYPYVDLNNLNGMQELSNGKLPWKKKLERIRDLLSKHQ